MAEQKDFVEDPTNKSILNGADGSVAKSNGSRLDVDEIRTRAYEIFQERQRGNEIDDWHKAETSVSADTTKSDAPASAQSPLPTGSPNKATDVALDGSLDGLTSAEADIRLRKFGPNSLPDIAAHPLRSALRKFWTPVPWMLEA